MDITVVVYHQQKHLTPYAVQTSDQRCLPATRSNIHKDHTTLYFKRLYIGAKICSDILYETKSGLHVATALSGVVEINYRYWYSLLAACQGIFLKMLVTMI